MREGGVTVLSRYIGGDPLRPARAAAVLTKDHRPAASAPAGRRRPAASAQARRPVRLLQLSGRLEPAVRVRLPLLRHHSCHRRQQRLAGWLVHPPRRRQVQRTVPPARPPLQAPPSLPGLLDAPVKPSPLLQHHCHHQRPRLHRASRACRRHAARAAAGQRTLWRHGFLRGRSWQPRLFRGADV